MRRDWLLAGLMTLSVLFTGCGGPKPLDDSDLDADSTDPSAAVSDLQGKVSYDGSSTVYPISLQMSEEFNAKYPQVEVSGGLSGTGGGFEKFMAGTTDLSNASRPVKKSEIEKGVEGGIEFVEVPVAYDGLTIVVNPANTWVNQLTVEQLQQIFLADSAAKTWKEIDPTWPDEQIRLFIPGTDSGTFDYFKEVVAGKEGSIRSEGVSTDENDNTLVGNIAGEKNALGFFGAAYYFSNKDKVRAVPIVNPSGDAVTPSPETIENGSYAPFGRPLFIYVNVKSLERTEVRRFVDFYLENAPRVAAEVGYVPLPAAIYEAARRNLDTGRTGTRFLDASGEPRQGTLEEIYGSAETP